MPTPEQEPDPNAPRADDGSWESQALRRVATRVSELPLAAPNGDDFGWEEMVLRRLRQRLADET